MAVSVAATQAARAGFRGGDQIPRLRATRSSSTAACPTESPHRSSIGDPSWQAHRRRRHRRDPFASADEAEPLIGGGLDADLRRHRSRASRRFARASHRDTARCVVPRRCSVTSACTISPPRASRTSEAACLRNTSEAAPRQRASEGGKCTPISPSAIVPSSASVRACKPTSASLWPMSFLLVRDADAAQDHRIAGTEGMHVIARGNADRAGRGRAGSFRSSSSAHARSSAVVSLRLSSAPSTRATSRPNHSAMPASSVNSRAARSTLRDERRGSHRSGSLAASARARADRARPCRSPARAARVSTYR